MDPIVAAALAARTNADVDRLEELLKKAFGGEHPRYLGDEETNWSTISSPADPTSLLFERVTNMIDAALELEAERRGLFGCASPAEAAHAFFSVPREGLGGMDDPARAKLAPQALVQVLDSDDPVRRPTIAFRDRGIGVTPAGAPDTILSLHRSNKLRKPWLHGIFGKGGSAACAFDRGTVIVSRRQPDLLDGVEDRIVVAVVREGEAADMGLPFWRYLVDGTPARLPYSVPAAAHPTFEPGTYVAHIGYLAGRMGVQNWQNEESIYAFAETVLFAPTLPYQLQDARTGAANVRPASRREPSVLSGLGQRLDALKAGDGTILARSGRQSVPVPEVGAVRLRWWLFEDLDKRRTRVAKGFVVAFTTNGQVHQAWDGARMQQLVERLRRVGNRIFVQVDCDGIELRKRSKVFDSFRAQVRRGPEGRALEEAVAYALDNDAELADFESEFVRQSLRSGGESVSAAFRKRLNRALRSKVPGLAPAAGTGPGPRPPRPRGPEDLYDEPTTMTGPAEITLLVGGRATAYMEINAVDGFVPDRGEIALEGPPLMPLLGVSDLRKGRLPLTLTAPATMPAGAVEVEAVLTWVRGNGGLGRIAWPIRVNVVAEIAPRPAPKAKGGTGPSKGPGDVALIWVAGRDEGWEDDVVGELHDLKGDDLAAQPGGAYADLKGEEATIPTIVLNKDFAEWAGYLRGVARGASDDALAVRREKYALAVGVVVANLTTQERKVARKRAAWEARANGSEEPPPAMTAEQIRRALAEAAHGVIALLPDFDEILGDMGR